MVLPASPISPSGVHFTGEQTPQLQFVYFDDFDAAGYLAGSAGDCAKFDETADFAEWHVSTVDDGSDGGETISVLDNNRNGVLRIVTNDATSDAVSIEKNGSAFIPAYGKRLTFQARLRVNDVDASNIFIGLVAPGSVSAGILADCPTEYIGFYIPDGSAAQIVQYGCGNGAGAGAMGSAASNETTAAVGTTAITDEEWFTVGFEFVPAGDERYRLKFFFNGVEVAEVNDSNVPVGDDLTPAVEIVAEGAAAESLDIDYILAAQDR